MANYPAPLEHGEGTANAPYHVVPDNIKGGWNVYSTMQPQEPQMHFDDKQEAIAYAEQLGIETGTGFTVEEHEAAQTGDYPEANILDD